MNHLLDRADRFAARAHAGQTRKYTGEPYIVHPRAVAKLLKEHGASDEVVAAGLLHDVIEDCDVTYDDLLKLFGKTVADLVLEVTDVSKPSDGNRAVRKELDRLHLAKASPDGMTVKLADLVHNTKSIVACDPGFAKRYLEEKEELLKVLGDGNADLYRMARANV